MTIEAPAQKWARTHAFGAGWGVPPRPPKGTPAAEKWLKKRALEFERIMRSVRQYVDNIGFHDATDADVVRITKEMLLGPTAKAFYVHFVRGMDNRQQIPAFRDARKRLEKLHRRRPDLFRRDAAPTPLPPKPRHHEPPQTPLPPPPPPSRWERFVHALGNVRQVFGVSP